MNEEPHDRYRKFLRTSDGALVIYEDAPTDNGRPSLQFIAFRSTRSRYWYQWVGRGNGDSEMPGFKRAGEWLSLTWNRLPLHGERLN